MGDAASLVMHIGGASHIWPIYEHTGHRFPCPERVIDAILTLTKNDGSFADVGSFLNVDALHGLKVMCAQSPGYRAADIKQLLSKHVRFTALHLEDFWAGDPDVHKVLAICDAWGVLYQLGYVVDSVVWTDHFSNALFYNSQAVINLCNS